MNYALQVQPADRQHSPPQMYFGVRLLLISIVMSLCGSVTELLLRYRPLPIHPTQLLMAAAFVLVAAQHGASFHRGHIRLMAGMAILLGWGAIGLFLRPFSDGEAYMHSAKGITLAAAAAWFLMWIPAKCNPLPTLGRFSAWGLLVMASVFLPMVVLGQQPPGPQVSDWHIHSGVARLPWTLDDPNYFASNLVVMCILALHGLNTASSRGRKNVCAAGLAAGCLLLALSMSRAGMIGLLGGMGTYFLLLGRQRTLLAMFAVVAGFLTIAGGAKIAQLILMRFQVNLSQESALLTRLRQYAYSIQTAVESPFGVGLGQSGSLAQEKVLYRIHSTLFEALAELGLFGFVALAVLVLAFASRWLNLGQRLKVGWDHCPVRHSSSFGRDVAARGPRGKFARGPRGQGPNLHVYHRWAALTALCVGLAPIAVTIAMMHRTSLWVVIGLTGWFEARAAIRRASLSAATSPALPNSQRVRRCNP